MGIATNKHGIYEGAIVERQHHRPMIEQFRAIIVSYVGPCLVRCRDLDFRGTGKGLGFRRRWFSPETLLATAEVPALRGGASAAVPKGIPWQIGVSGN
jgi:hypothetical protein